MELGFSGGLQLGGLPANTVKDIQKSKEVAKQQAAKVASSLPKQQLSGFDSPLDVGVRGAIPGTAVNSKPVTIGRLNPKTPEVDDAIMGATYDITSGGNPQEILAAYPELTDKWDAVMGYISDAQDLEVDEKTLYDLYPELSPKVKTTIRSQFKTQLEEMNAQAELESDPLTGGENVKAFGLGVAQGVGNVGYNISGGKQINTLGDYVGEKLKDTKFAKKVKQLAIDTFGADEVSKFEDQEGLRRAGENPNSVENNANIMRQVGGRRFEQSTAGKAGEGVGEFVAEAALTAPLGGIAAGGTKAALGLGKSALGATARGALAGGITGAAGAEVNAIGSKGRLATKDELKTGIIAGTITGGILRKQFMSSKNEIQNSILPKMTPTELSERGLRGGLKTNSAGKVSAVLSKDEQEMAKLAEKFVNPKSTSVSNLNKAKSIIKSEADKLRGLVKGSNYKWTTDEVLSEMDSIDLPDTLRADPIKQKAFELVRGRFQKILDKAPKTAEGLLDARQEFDNIVNKTYPNLYTSEAETPMKIAITSLRQIPNQILNANIADDVVQQSLRKQSLLMRIEENFATKLEQVGTSDVSRFVNKNKEILKVGGLLAAGAAGSRAVDSFSQSTSQ